MLFYKGFYRKICNSTNTKDNLTNFQYNFTSVLCFKTNKRNFVLGYFW